MIVAALIATVWLAMALPLQASGGFASEGYESVMHEMAFIPVHSILSSLLREPLL